MKFISIDRKTMSSSAFIVLTIILYALYAVFYASYVQYVDITEVLVPLSYLVQIFSVGLLYLNHKHTVHTLRCAILQSTPSKEAQGQITRLQAALRTKDDQSSRHAHRLHTLETSLAQLEHENAQILKEFYEEQSLRLTFKKTLESKDMTFDRMNAKANAHWKLHYTLEHHKLWAKLHDLLHTPRGQLHADLQTVRNENAAMRAATDFEVEVRLDFATKDLKQEHENSKRERDELLRQLAVKDLHLVALEKKQEKLIAAKNKAEALISSANQATKDAEASARLQVSSLLEMKKERDAFQYFNVCLSKALPQDWIALLTPRVNQWLSTSSPPAAQTDSLIRMIAESLPAIPQILGLVLSSSAPLCPSMFGFKGLVRSDAAPALPTATIVAGPAPSAPIASILAATSPLTILPSSTTPAPPIVTDKSTLAGDEPPVAPRGSLLSRTTIKPPGFDAGTGASGSMFPSIALGTASSAKGSDGEASNVGSGAGDLGRNATEVASISSAGASEILTNANGKRSREISPSGGDRAPTRQRS